MAFDFYAAYVLTPPDNEFSPQIVTGCQMVKIGDRPTPSVVFLLTNGEQRIRRYDSTAVHDFGDKVVIDNDEGPHHWEFERLTLKRWKQLGEDGSVIDYPDIKGDFADDKELQQYYVHNFLMSKPWYEAQGRKYLESSGDLSGK